MEMHKIREKPTSRNMIPGVSVGPGWSEFRLDLLRHLHRRNPKVRPGKIPGERKVGGQNNMEETVSSLRGLHYHMAHNLRAPLRAIQGFSSELQESYGNALGEEGYDLLRRINDSTVRMEKLIRIYQDYVALSYREFNWRMVGIERLMNTVASRTSSEFETRKPQIEVCPRLPEFWTCPGLLEQILTQLFRNALTYVDPSVAPSIKVWTLENENHLLIFVKDNGIGVAREYQERIFWLFERLAPALKYPGTGMGLPIAQKCASRLGGRISLESELGVGSCFVVELPREPQPRRLSISEKGAQPKGDVTREEKPTKPMGTILLAEDDENEFLLMKMAFGKIGVENVFRRVRNGEEVICYLKAADPFSDRQEYPFPSLLLLDLKMPMMGGFEVLEWIRSQPRYQQLIVAILSASTNTDDVTHAYHSSANSYLVKPDTFGALVEMVSQIKGYWLDLNTIPPSPGEESII
jgi:CheY-like chemotaxis protein